MISQPLTWVAWAFLTFAQVSAQAYAQSPVPSQSNAPSQSPSPSQPPAAGGPTATPSAAPKEAALKDSAGVEEKPQPIETLRQKVSKKAKSKTAKKIASAFRALKSKNFSEARALANGLKNDELFSDAFYGIQAMSYRKEAEHGLQKKQYDSVIKNSKKAIDLIFEIQSKHPYSSYLKKSAEDLADCELMIGESMLERGDQPGAMLHFERAFQRLANSNQLGNIAPETIEAYGKGCSKKSTLLCGSWLQRFSTINSKGSEEWKAVAKFFPQIANRGKPPNTARSTQTYKGPDLDQVSFESAMALYQDGKYSSAIKAFYRFLDEYPRSTHRYRARYWMAQGLSQDQQHEKAQRAYEDLLQDAPLTYYGLLASLASGKSAESLIAANFPDAISTDPFLLPQEVYRLRRAERLISEGATAMAEQELREFRSRDHLSNSFLIYLATLHTEAGNHSGAFQILGDLIQRGGGDLVYNSYGLRLIFPTAFYDEIQKASADQKLDPILVLSLIKQESAFQVEAGSTVGASGLMQLMPATAVDTEPGVRRVDLLDPTVNIRVGTKYLKKMLDKYNGNIVFALASYNAGPGALDRWLRDGKAKRGMLDFIELIPYKETREYVGSIIKNYYWYSKRIVGEAPKSLTYFWNMVGPPQPTAAVDGTSH
ncbi:MAG: transglycosylase SLT domain-containing protein [Bdellovibrionales bacterium]|nr:transglycosylase SLT domain-containing protein [Bdellovibrionales bacterium]